MATKQIKDITAEQTVINDEDYMVLQEAGGTNKKFKKQAIFDIIYPVGCFYVQYPDAASSTDATAFPTSTRPATLFGGTWVSQFDTENVYFRTAGTDYQTRTTGLSADQFQSHLHNIATATGTDKVLVASPTYSGASKNGGAYNAAQTTATENSAVTKNYLADGANGTPRVGAVTEPRNRLMKVWKRTA